MRVKRQRPQMVEGERVNVGLYLSRRIDDDVSALATIKGVTKSALFAAGIGMILSGLSEPERAALEAMRAARKEQP